MKKLTALKNVSLILALVGVVYIVANHMSFIKDEVLSMVIPETAVQGASTKRAEEISQKVKQDLVSQFGMVQERVLQIVIPDAIEEVSKLQKIPRDMKAIQEFSKEQIDTVLKSKK
jgi:hypothetical protein